VQRQRVSLSARWYQATPNNTRIKRGTDHTHPVMAGEGRYPRLCRVHREKSWMPAFAGMTGRARIVP
jgi:hypothetical protein